MNSDHCKPNRIQILEACNEALLTRIGDLKDSNDVLVDLNMRLMRALVRVLATREPERWYLEQEKHQRLLDELRDLRAMVVRDSFDDAAAVIAQYGNDVTGTGVTIQ